MEILAKQARFGLLDDLIKLAVSLRATQLPCFLLEKGEHMGKSFGACFEIARGGPRQETDRCHWQAYSHDA